MDDGIVLFRVFDGMIVVVAVVVVVFKVLFVSFCSVASHVLFWHFLAWEMVLQAWSHVHFSLFALSFRKSHSPRSYIGSVAARRDCTFCNANKENSDEKRVIAVAA